MLFLLPCLFMACQKEFTSLTNIDDVSASEMPVPRSSKMVYDLAELSTELQHLIKNEASKKGVFEQAELFQFEKGQLVKTIFLQGGVKKEVFFNTGSSFDQPFISLSSARQEFKAIRIECTGTTSDGLTPCHAKVDKELGQLYCECESGLNAMEVSLVGAGM